MKAITVKPIRLGPVCLENLPEPEVRDGSILAEVVAFGGPNVVLSCERNRV